ncbi:hypothetical protein BKA82DRAFT_4352026 [Pisolithus tinctorius]|nr:hypothetical protein BKA82DRAFT_4352026 [Pisolithus tinctorius]
MCDPCLGLAQWLTDKARAEDIDFQCPGCHELEEGGAKRKELHSVLSIHSAQYLGREFPCWISQSSSRGFVKGHLSLKCVLSPPLFLSSSAQEWKFKVQLPSLLNTTIEEYHTSDSLLYQKVIFDFGTDRKFSRWSMRIKKLGEKLGTYAFKRKIIFITVHSEVTRGDLFAGKGESGEDVAMEVGEFMKCLFTSPLQHMVYRFYAALKQSIAQLQPEYTVAFTAKNFLNAVVKIFIVSYGVKVLIEGHALENVIHDLLDISLELRMHTDVMLFHLSGLGLPRAPWLLSPAPLTAAPLLAIYRYSWYHSHRRPWGTSLSMGCLNCGAIRPWA